MNPSRVRLAVVCRRFAEWFPRMHRRHKRFFATESIKPSEKIFRFMSTHVNVVRNGESPRQRQVFSLADGRAREGTLSSAHKIIIMYGSGINILCILYRKLASIAYLLCLFTGICGRKLQSQRAMFYCFVPIRPLRWRGYCQLSNKGRVISCLSLNSFKHFQFQVQPVG